jgi:hypothetical protein
MTALVNFGIGALLALPAIGCAQERNATPNYPPAQGQTSKAPGTLYRAQDGRQAAPDAKPGEDEKTPRRLESVTWNSVKHQLTWVISKGNKDSSGFKASKSDNYEISMDSATMTFNGETRRFSKEEAANVHVLMDVIAKYAVDSTIWWDEGQGEPLDGSPAPSQKQEEKKQPARRGTAVLHIGLRTPQGISPETVQGRIDDLERQVEQLKQLKYALEAASPTALRSN